MVKQTYYVIKWRKFKWTKIANVTPKKYNESFVCVIFSFQCRTTFTNIEIFNNLGFRWPFIMFRYIHSIASSYSNFLGKRKKTKGFLVEQVFIHVNTSSHQNYMVSSFCVYLIEMKRGKHKKINNNKKKKMYNNEKSK